MVCLRGSHAVWQGAENNLADRLGECQFGGGAAQGGTAQGRQQRGQMK